ncbi:hypothetical protein HYH02_004720 [Chlamydomonas schloesseri]|uniref:Uncharacterized protein n=1 Tax=Chlamydomonas schloesseri TaxID=2026947 RepID=A0A835WPB4_9CHLO|nr:hypothetical protein HYH02_004720 [Chlamydomonas schloesseri]|eukprot:KAG2450888.1 hypothetical protein HYH02_004720 [Chlamydomonas schloesseri]
MGYQSSMYLTGHFLNITFCDIWQDKGRTQWRSIADFLLHPDCRGVFEVITPKDGSSPGDRTQLVRLNPAQVRAAALEAGGPLDLHFSEEAPDPVAYRNAIAKAVQAGWPGKSPVSAFRRRVALELSAMRNGPLGDHSCLSAAFTSRLRQVMSPDLLSHVTSAGGGRLHLKSLLARPHEGGPKDELSTPAHAFLRCVQLPYDACCVLDLHGLLEWHANGGSGAGPLGSAAPPRRAGGGGGGVHIDLSGLVPRYGTPGADQASPYVSGSSGGGGADREDGLTLPDAAAMSFPGAAAASQLRRALAGRLAVAKGAGADDGSSSSSGGSVESQLPRFALPWSSIAPMVAASKAAALQPSLKQAGPFRAFLLHAASGGAFDTVRLYVTNPQSGAREAVDCVQLNPEALRRLAPAGMAAAIAAAWPAGDDFSRLRRAAAHVLSRWPRGSPGGDGAYTGQAGLVGAEIKKREPALFGVYGGPNKGLFTKLDESGAGRRPGASEAGGYLVYVREDGKEGYLRLKAHALVRDFPADHNDTELGLKVEVPAAGAASRPAVGAAASVVPAADPWAGMGPPPEASAAPQDEYVGYGYAPDAQQQEAYDAYGTNGYDGYDGSAMAAPAADAGGAPAAPSAAVVAEGGVQHQVIMSLTPPVVTWVRDIAGFNSMIAHCNGVAQLGVAVHAVAGKAVVVGLYAPAANTASDGANSAWDAYGNPSIREPATVYLFRVTDVLGGGAAAAAGGSASGGSAAGGSTANGGAGSTSSLLLLPDGGLPGAKTRLKALLESPMVVKTVHSCDQVLTLSSALGGCMPSPMLDLRILLRGLTALLPGLAEGAAPLPALPPPLPAAMAAGPMGAVAQAGLSAYVNSLQAALAGTGLWSDRPALLAALVARHTAALRDDIFGVRDWDSNPAAHEAALVAAAQHLPELYEAVSGEGFPWVAMACAAAASTKAMEKLLAQGQA